MMNRYGFWCDPTLPLWLRIDSTLQAMPLHTVLNHYKLKHTAFHNLCTILQPPVDTHKLLWLGLKFCIEKPLPKPVLATYIERLTYDIRVKTTMAANEDSIVINQSGQRIFLEGDTDYDPKLYLPSTDYIPDDTTPQIEQAIRDFSSGLEKLIDDNHQSRKHNIPPSTRRLIRQIGLDNPDFIVTPTDKNLGPAILERAIYKQRCLQDHLLDTTSYKQLTPEEAQSKLDTSRKTMEAIVRTHQHALAQNEITYFKRVFKIKCRIPQFYATPKVHKSPWKTRPIVSCVNSTLGYLSKWTDRQLQRVIHLCPGYLKDSASLLQKLKQMDPLTPTTVMIVADAVSMYTNIDTTHGLQTLKNWLNLHRADLPQGFPTDMIIAATELIMTFNVFQFDDTFWHQSTGTAMGTPVACTFATIYYAYHEETSFLYKFHQDFRTSTATAPLLLYGRLIDDSIQIWDTALLPPTMPLHSLTKKIETEMAFGILPWEVNPPARETSFLDLHIVIEPDGTITTRTFIKPMNLHLYIPPESAHSQGVLKSLIFGNVFRYWQQNSHPTDFISTTRDFYGHLLNRGYKPTTLTPIFRAAAEKIHQRALKEPTVPSAKATNQNQLYLHWEFHPRDITRYEIRSLFNTTLAPLISNPPLAIKRLTIAYTNPPNLRRCLTKTQLQEPKGEQVSLYVAKLRKDIYQPASV
jgi:hypothetical protein